MAGQVAVMAITRACYCNRYDVQRAIDFAPGVDRDAATDRAIGSASDNIDRHLHAVFFPWDGTQFFDWPNQGGSGGGQYAYPWRLWLDAHRIVVMTALASAGVTITLDEVFLEPVNNPSLGRTWYEYIELDRSTNAAWGGADTPQHAIAVTGTWGSCADADPAGTLTAAVATGDTTISVSDASQAGPGDLLVLGYGRGTAPFPSDTLGHAGALAPYQGERILVTASSPAGTGLAQSGSGCSTALSSDNTLTTTGTGTLNVGEVVILDSERMLVEQIVGSVATVRRAWDGTVLATHSAAEIYALRSLAVTRAMYGTVASSYTSGAAVYRHRVPSIVRDLAIAEAENQVLQEGSGYARMVGSGEGQTPAPGRDLAAKWDEAVTAFGRRGRIRAV